MSNPIINLRFPLYHTDPFDIKIARPSRGGDKWFFGLCYAMDWGYKGWNPYVEKHLAIFVNCFLSRADSSIKSLAREGFSQFMPPYRTITSNKEPDKFVSKPILILLFSLIVWALLDFV